MTTVTPLMRVTRAVISGLGKLPEPAQRLIAGKPLTLGGNTMFTEVQMALRLLNAMPGESFENLPLDAGRRQIDEEAWIFGSTPEIGLVEEIDVPTRDGSVRARVYVARPDRPTSGAVVYFHGGGWVLGGLDSTDSVCRAIADQTDLAVVSIDYRLAPEHPFPAALHDCLDAYRWVRAEGRWGDRVAVAGDSAGGNLAAVVSNLTIEEGGPDFQLLFFPVTDLGAPRAEDRTESYRLFADGFFLTAAQMDWYRGHYLATEADAVDPRVSPLLIDDAALAGVAPAHVAVAGFDPLRDEGIAYAEKLQAAGVPCTLQVATGHIHAFTNASGVGVTGAAELAESIDALRRGLGRGAPSSRR